jgi:AAA15 family ATPase/GTPase
MIESIEIKNFRCFKDTKIAGFGLVNLFGGLNNSGKTALLEAIYLSQKPNEYNLMFCHQAVRNETSSAAKDNPGSAWNNFFYQQQKTEEILLKSVICVDDPQNPEIKLKQNPEIKLTCSIELDNAFNEEENSLLTFGEKQSTLTVEALANGSQLYYFLNIANKKGFSFNKIEEQSSIHFIPASAKLSGTELARQYDIACEDIKKEELIFEAIQLIDKTIKRVKTSTIGGGVLRLQREGENPMPISLFGDAINRIVDYILKIISYPNAVLIVDEIENGIHYTKHTELWEILFKLAIEFNVQIFSTSHSLEMIRAFAKVADSPEFLEKAAYFEMTKSQKTGLIKGIKHDIKTLLFELDRNMAVRG